jgi:hypothetical protein
MLDALDITEAEAAGLTELAALDLAMARRFAARAQAAEDADEANGLARSYQRAARSYRQTLALKLRLKRERARLLREAAAPPVTCEPDDDDETPVDRPPKPVRDARRIAERKAELLGPLRRIAWTEYEDHDCDEEVEAFFADLEETLAGEAQENDFGLVYEDGAWTEEPLEAQLAGFCVELGLPEAAAAVWRDLPDPPRHAPPVGCSQWRGSG